MSSMTPQHSKDFASVRYGERLFTFTSKQAVVMRELWLAMEAGCPVLSDRYLLDAADSSCLTLRDIFRRNPAWGVLIVSCGKGLRKLAVENNLHLYSRTLDALQGPSMAST